MKSANKASSFALMLSGIAFAFLFLAQIVFIIFGTLSILCSILSIIYAVNGLKTYNSNNSIGGKSQAIGAIVVSGMILLIGVMLIVVKLMMFSTRGY